jgi:3-dehydrosphinganine reductase
MGRSVAIELSRKGANIIIVSRSVGKLKAALEAIQVGWSGSGPIA